MLEHDLPTPDFTEGETYEAPPDFDIFTIVTQREINPASVSVEQIPLLNEFVQRKWITEDTRIGAAVVKAYEKERRALPDTATLFHLEALVNVRLLKNSNTNAISEYMETVKRHFPDRGREDIGLNTERAFVSKNVDLNQLSAPRR